MAADDLSPEEQRWLERDEARWRKAHAIVEKYPHLDPSGVYHTLRNLERSPEERLRRGLRHGRIRSIAG